MKEYIENVLAPKLQGDGGWVEFVSYEKWKIDSDLPRRMFQMSDLKPLCRLDHTTNQRGKGRNC